MVRTQARSGGISSRKAIQRYQAWLDLRDFSMRLGLAGLKTQGFSESEAWKIWCKRWAKASQEHQRTNEKVVKLLAKRDKPLKP